MFILYAEKNKAIVRKKEPVTSGSVNVYPVQFEFSVDWDGLDKTAVFRAGDRSIAVLLSSDHRCDIPWEVLVKPNLHLYAGVCGTRGGDIVLPTIYADFGVISEGATAGEIARPPTPSVYEQILEALSNKADGLLVDGQILQLLSGDYPLAEVVLPTGSGGEGGVTDHRLLTGRNAENQHPIEAISGLADALKTIPRAMTADELRKILMGGK